MKKNKKNYGGVLIMFFIVFFCFSFVSNIVVADGPVPLGPDQTTSFDNDTYKLLAPIGNLTEAPKDIGSYFNIIFKIAIGLCGALAVIMIIIGGIQYMGDESIFSKTEAKSKITAAIFGLLIALGSYALLNTINPALLGGKINIKQVSAEIDEETEPWDGYEAGDNITGCPEGFVDILVNGATPNKINVCKSIKTNLENMINEAALNNIIISGSGSRTTASQIQKRKQNCGGEAYVYDENAICNPKTALPGKSNHEKGLAVDFNCNGKTMEQSGGINSVCYKWLKENAKKYNLSNNYQLLGESWHWSTTGT